MRAEVSRAPAVGGTADDVLRGHGATPALRDQRDRRAVLREGAQSRAGFPGDGDDGDRHPGRVAEGAAEGAGLAVDDDDPDRARLLGDARLLVERQQAAVEQRDRPLRVDALEVVAVSEAREDERRGDLGAG